MEAQFDLKTYDFTLPQHLIAQKACEPRDASRLLVVRRSSGTWEHRRFLELPMLLGAQDVLIANNSKVMPCRFLGHRVLEGGLGGKVEFFALTKKNSSYPEGSQPSIRYEGLMRSSNRVKKGFRFELNSPPLIEKSRPVYGVVVQDPNLHGLLEVEFSEDPFEKNLGKLPLPPYVQESTENVQQYQTIFAEKLGSVAAPTAGLHFTDRVLEALKKQGVGWETITLHVGLGTFKPVKTVDIREHWMHEEWFEIPENLASKCENKRIIAVGTTALRALESSFRDGKFQAGPQQSQIFFYPGGKRFEVVQGLLTNFHLPQSTLFMLVCAFAGTELMKNIYQDAITQEYRFFSFGDAMLIL